MPGTSLWTGISQNTNVTQEDSLNILPGEAGKLDKVCSRGSLCRI